jgi:hypothetical protein
VLVDVFHVAGTEAGSLVVPSDTGYIPGFTGTAVWISIRVAVGVETFLYASESTDLNPGILYFAAFDTNNISAFVHVKLTFLEQFGINGHSLTVVRHFEFGENLKLYRLR